MKTRAITAIANQTGAVLIVSLLILLVLTIIGISSIRSTAMEERMASNIRDKNLAFQAAEAALKQAESEIDNLVSVVAFDTDGSDGYYDNSISKIQDTLAWDASDSREYTAAVAQLGVGTAPRYVVQHFSSIGSSSDTLNLDNYGQGTGAGVVRSFRITARATGGTNSSAVILQSTYGRRMN